MTPFMLAVQALLDGEEVPQPDTEPSQTRSVAVATDTQFIARSLAEQLVSEANAILAEHGNRITLVDDSGFGELGFTLGYRDRSARVQTVLSGHTAVGRLVVPGLPGLPGLPQDEPRQLTTGDELQALVLSLLADSSHH